jgi:hypothetical protein
MEKIKKEVEETGRLNRAYIPILQGISPGELQNAENALNFAKILVTQWLAQYKFRTWTQHSSTGAEVTSEDRQKRAEEIAKTLCDHGFWKTHARSIKIDDLERMRLKITDYSKVPDLEDAITRYHTLLQMTFSTNIYKIFETPSSQVMRFMLAPTGPIQLQPGLPPAAPQNKIFIEYRCTNCNASTKLQINFAPGELLEPQCKPFPTDNVLNCPGCGTQQNLVDIRRQIEAQFKKSIVP